MRIVIVGPCAAGKTTLAQELRARGYQAFAIAQEHSAIVDLWRHAGDPAHLIYLDVSLAVIIARGRKGFPAWLREEQQRRLASARAAADFYLDTDQLSEEQILARAVEFLEHAPSAQQPRE